MGGGVRQTFVLSDQNFSPALPCTEGECLKIIRVEIGSLAEIVTCFLDVMKGKGIPTGSVALLCSVAHLQMRGVAGYMSDLGVEIERIGSVFRGGGYLPSRHPNFDRRLRGWYGSSLQPRGWEMVGSQWVSALAGHAKVTL